MNPDLNSQLILLLPEMIIAFFAMFVLVLDLYFKDKEKNLVYGLSQLALLFAAISTATQGFEIKVLAFNGMFISDSISTYLKLLAYISMSLVFIYSRTYLKARLLLKGEYFSLSLFVLLGVMLMISSMNLLMIYMGLELLSLSLYALVALDRDNPKASEAAMKYFVLGALASGLLLYGMSMLYGLTGSLDLLVIANVLQETPMDQSILVFGLVFIVVGIAFKFGAAPFQMWVPDVYQGAPLPITMLIGSVPKFAAVAMSIRLLFQGLETLSSEWQQMFLFMALLSMLIGNITAIAQTNIKRMLAYSTISHVGFIFLGLMSGSVNGASAILFYIACYALMTLAAFGLIIALSANGKDFELLDDFKGLNKRNPWAAAIFLITMLSLAGIPPTVGFYAKFSILESIVSAGYIWPAVFAVMMALIGMYYYLRIIKLMYFDEAPKLIVINIPKSLLWVLTINTGSIILLGIFPKTLMSIAAITAGFGLQS